MRETGSMQLTKLTEVVRLTVKVGYLIELSVQFVDRLIFICTCGPNLPTVSPPLSLFLGILPVKGLFKHEILPRLFITLSPD